MRTVLCVAAEDRIEKLSTTIRAAGYRCMTASSGVEAERLFVANAVDLLILDTSDAGMFGEQLAQHLKKIYSVKILLLTQNVEPAATAKFADVILVESAEPKGLLDAVAHLTDPGEHQANRAIGTGTQ